MSEGYSLREVGKLLGLSRSILCGLIDAGFVAPTRGRRREYRFSFHDLVLLRTAQGLSRAKLPPARILRSLRRLRAQLPDRVPLSGLRIEAVGDSVVVNEGHAQWQPDDGQYVLRFQVAATAGAHAGIAFLDAEPVPAAPSADEWFARGSALESDDPAAAEAAYRHALAADAGHVSAYTNLGRLLHESERSAEAESIYRCGLERAGADATLLFNLAVLLEDGTRRDEAVEAYRAALAADPDMSDAHYNLALLCEAIGLSQEAVRHFAAFRRLRTPR